MKQNPSNQILVSERLRLYTEDPRLMIQKQTRKSFLIIIFTLIIAGGLVFYLILQINKLASNLGNKQNQLASDINTKSLNVNQAQTYEQVEPFAAKVQAALPSPDNLLDYQNALEQAAIASGVQISVNFAAQGVAANQGATAGAAPKSIDHTVELKGNLNNFAIFISALENLPYFVKVNNFNLASQTNLGQDSTATISLKVFVQ